MSDLAITAIFTGLAALLAVGVPAWIALRKARQEIVEKTAALEATRKVQETAAVAAARNGVIDDLEKALNRCSTRNDAADVEIAELRGQIAKLYGELAELRRLIVAKETRVEKQATQVESLQTAVTLMKESPAVALPQEIVIADVKKEAVAKIAGAEKLPQVGQTPEETRRQQEEDRRDR